MPEYRTALQCVMQQLPETEQKAVLSRLQSQSFLLIPSFLDVHVHLREPGFFYKEGIESGTRAAAASGYGGVCAMPNLSPVPDSMEHLQAELDCIARSAAVPVYPYGSLTVGEKGKTLADLEALAPCVCGFSDDGVGLNDAGLMAEAMARAKALGRIVAAHCEDLSLRNGGVIHAGCFASAHGLPGICSESEWKPIERDLKLAEKTGVRYHVCHVSAKESVQLIRDAKKSGVNVTCETAPHYLVLDDTMLRDEGRFKMNPPIRSAADRDALIEGLLDGTVDMIATDHAPHSAEEKSKGLLGSAMGITGLEAAFPVLYTKLVKRGVLSLDKLVELMSTAPRARFGFAPAEESGSYALWEVNDAYVLDPAAFISKGKATPFAGETVFGRCVLNITEGRVVYKNEAMLLPD